MTQIIEIIDEVGNIDLCEVEQAPGTRVLRVIEVNAVLRQIERY